MPPKSILAKVEEKCGDCDKCVTAKDQGLQCEVCNEWFHARCQKISEDTYSSIKNEDSVHWYCYTCNKEVTRVIKSIPRFQARQDKFEHDLMKCQENLALLQIEMKSVREQSSATDTKLETLVEAKLVEGLERRVESRVDGKVKQLSEDMSETLEIEKRKGNLVFHGLKEGKDSNDTNEKPHDWQMVEELLRNGLKLDPSRHVDEVTRIGRSAEGKIRPLRVKIKSMESRIEIMKRARDLKDCEEFKRVFIAPDLTRKQQQTDKDLRDHVKKFREEGQTGVMIRYGKVIKNESGGQVVVLYQPPTDSHN